jgi:hypothetical protein
MHNTVKCVLLACGAMMAAASTANASLINVAASGLASPTCTAPGCGGPTELALSITQVLGTSALTYANDHMSSMFDLPASVEQVTFTLDQTGDHLKNLDARIVNVTTSTVLDTKTGITHANPLVLTYTGSEIIVGDVYAVQLKDTCPTGCSASTVTITLAQLDLPKTPLPAALPLFGAGLAGLGLLMRRRKQVQVA